MKVDDDVLVDPFGLLKMLESERGNGRKGKEDLEVLCRINANTSVDRKEGTRW